ncbi:MAG: DNA polymerase III subunit delta, partial [Planctomycetota bacterium]
MKADPFAHRAGHYRASVSEGGELQRLRAVVGSSWRLRMAALDAVLASWDGPVRREVEPADLDAIILGLDTPSLFEPASCWVISCGGAYIKRHGAALLAQCGQPVSAGCLILVVDGFAKGDRLRPALTKAEALIEAAVPRPRELEGWLVQRLLDLPLSVQRPQAVAQALIEHRGDDIDALLAVIEQMADVVDAGEVVDEALVHQLLGGDAERPMWAVVDAVLSGQVAKALRLFHAGG